MSTILVWREKIQKLYADYSLYITIVARLVLGGLVFGLINSKIGYMKAVSSIVCTAGLTVVCAFLPVIVMVLAAMALVLLHFYSLSIGVALVSAILFVLMYIFYLQFSTKQSWLILVTAVAFALKVPLVIPVAVGLLGGFVSLAPIVCGTIAYYVIHSVRVSSGTFKSEGLSEIINAVTAAAKQLLGNKEMWLMVAVIVACTLLVYGIRTRSVNHAWKIATGAGAAAGLVLGLVGNIVLNVDMSLISLGVGSVLAIVFGLLAEILFLSVDYTRTEYVEFEDDEYHYYVKAVPKIGVTEPEKNVKRITRRQDGPENEKRAGRKAGKPEGGREVSEVSWEEHTDDILLTRSLSKELGLENPKKK